MGRLFEKGFFLEEGAQSNHYAGVANVHFREISVWKTIWDLEFSEHLL